MKERWMGLDYGTKTVSVAVSDALGITAQGVETVTRKSNKKLRQTLARIEALIEEYEVSKVSPIPVRVSPSAGSPDRSSPSRR